MRPKITTCIHQEWRPSKEHTPTHQERQPPKTHKLPRQAWKPPKVHKYTHHEWRLRFGYQETCLNKMTDVFRATDGVGKRSPCSSLYIHLPAPPLLPAPSPYRPQPIRLHPSSLLIKFASCKACTLQKRKTQNGPWRNGCTTSLPACSRFVSFLRRNASRHSGGIITKQPGHGRVALC